MKPQGKDNISLLTQVDNKSCDHEFCIFCYLFQVKVVVETVDKRDVNCSK